MNRRTPLPFKGTQAVYECYDKRYRQCDGRVTVTKVVDTPSKWHYADEIPMAFCETTSGGIQWHVYAYWGELSGHSMNEPTHRLADDWMDEKTGKLIVGFNGIVHVEGDDPVDNRYLLVRKLDDSAVGRIHHEYLLPLMGEGQEPAHSRRYWIEQEISLPGWAPERHDDVGGLLIGYKSNVTFESFLLVEDEHGQKTVLRDVVLESHMTDLTPDDAHSVASSIVYDYYKSVGLETAYHFSARI